MLVSAAMELSVEVVVKVVSEVVAQEDSPEALSALNATTTAMKKTATEGDLALPQGDEREDSHPHPRRCRNNRQESVEKDTKYVAMCGADRNCIALSLLIVKSHIPATTHFFLVCVLQGEMLGTDVNVSAKKQKAAATRHSLDLRVSSSSPSSPPSQEHCCDTVRTRQRTRLSSSLVAHAAAVVSRGSLRSCAHPAAAAVRVRSMVWLRGSSDGRRGTIGRSHRACCDVSDSFES